ncbi:hypothetical protein Q5P01_000134 [Channa striata]|uniref:Uncharacterized protein n=1 Tax=Channa striata TaxID=64152 RepID=A0AA88LM14_CHASR|nr:hypothetical protein Q5P01_000134 [Channa striata]
MWRVDGRIQEERMKHEDELRIVRQSSRKDIDELQTQMAGILIGHAKQKDVLQEKNLTLQKALEEMANELRTSQERCAGTQDELDRCKRTLQEAEEESARCRENAAKLDAQRAEMEGLIREQNKREHALVEERDATSHRVVQLQPAKTEIEGEAESRDSSQADNAEIEAAKALMELGCAGRYVDTVECNTTRSCYLEIGIHPRTTAGTRAGRTGRRADGTGGERWPEGRVALEAGIRPNARRGNVVPNARGPPPYRRGR